MASIAKASKYTHAKTGYLVFSGKYPRMKHKYFKTKAAAKQQQTKWTRMERRKSQKARRAKRHS